MDLRRGSWGVEIMTPCVVASGGMLYQEVDRGPAPATPTIPRTRVGEASYL